jgi:putative hydrolase of the HAD superfamily
MARVRAVLLDVGGVFHLPNPDLVNAALAPFGVAAPAELCDRAHYAGVAALTAFDEGDREVWRAYQRAYVDVLGVAPSDHEPAVDALLDAFVRSEMWTRVVPGSREALADLAARGYELAIVSNSTGTVERRLHEHAICQVGPGPGVPVAAVVDSAVVGHAKPDPRIFDVALRALGVAPGDVAHVGDTPGADVAGARAAGIEPILVDPFDDHPGFDGARVAGLADVAQLLAGSARSTS